MFPSRMLVPSAISMLSLAPEASLSSFHQVTTVLAVPARATMARTPRNLSLSSLRAALGLHLLVLLVTWMKRLLPSAPVAFPTILPSHCGRLLQSIAISSSSGRPGRVTTILKAVASLMLLRRVMATLCMTKAGSGTTRALHAQHLPSQPSSRS